MININLLPPERRKASKSSALPLGNLPPLDTLIPIAGSVLASAFIGLVVPWLINSYYFQPQLDALATQKADLQTEVQKYNVTLKSIQEAVNRKNELEQQEHILDEVTGGGLVWSEILNELRAITPANLWFDAVITDSTTNAVKISGTALDYNSVAYFFRNLQNAENFENPVLDKTEMAGAAAGGGVATVKFSISCAIKRSKKV